MGWRFACRACGRGWGSRRWLRVVWRAVGAGILNAGALGGRRGGELQFRPVSVPNVAAGVEASLTGADGLNSDPPMGACD